MFGEVTWISHFCEFLNCLIFWSDSFNGVLPPNKLPWVMNWNGFQCITSISCPGPDGYENIMTSVSYSFPYGLIERRVIIKWFYRLYCIVSHKIQCTNGKLKYIFNFGKQNGNNFNWRIWYNNKYHINNSSNNKSPLPRGLQPLPHLLSHTEELMWYFLWIDLSNIQFRFDVMEEKEGTWMQTVLDV